MKNENLDPVAKELRGIKYVLIGILAALVSVVGFLWFMPIPIQ